MRTSGSGREGWMTAIPIGILLLFVTVVVGGPRELLETIEGSLRIAVDSVSKFFS